MEGLWAWLTALVTAAVFVASGASAFGLNLRRGVSGLLGAPASSVDSAGRHEQLRRDFKNVSRSIGRSLIIFIDDLDRCRPEKVVETLEAVNFLVTAGECAVVMGMDYRRVQHCVGFVRKDMAEAELATAPSDGGEADGRAAYAHQYLQKLVNVELPISAEHERIKGLAARPAPPAEDDGGLIWLWRWPTWFWRLRVWMIVGALVASMPFVVPGVRDTLVPADPFVPILKEQGVVTATVQDDAGRQGSEGPPPSAQPSSPLDDVERAYTVAVGRNTPDAALWPVVVGLLLVLIPGVLLLLHRLHERGRLKLWGDVGCIAPSSG